MKTLTTIITGLILIVGCVLSAIANEDILPPPIQTPKIMLKHPVGCFLEDTPVPLGMASHAIYSAKMEQSEPVLQKPVATWLLLRLTPCQLPVTVSRKTLLLGAVIVILPGFFLRTLRNKNV
ncbi:MAG: hypothetical protein AB7I18_01110 [Candidatus Berkiella sp.]